VLRFLIRISLRLFYLASLREIKLTVPGSVGCLLPILYLAAMAALQFQLEQVDKNSKARTGKITTDHGEILTPIFMPVGTAGTVKAVTQQQLLHDVKAQIILGNTYHLYLRPGLEVLEKAGACTVYQLEKTNTDRYGATRFFHWRVQEKLKKKASLFNRILTGANIYLLPKM
jgi:queuine tRNA-ribosyltransferase